MDEARLFGLKIPEKKTFDDYKYLLPDVCIERQNIISKKVFNKDKITCLLSEIILKKVLKKHYSIDIADYTLIKNDYGKPYILEIDNLHFNISHSGHWIMCVISSKPVGVDIEKIIDVDYSIIGRYFSLEEINHFNKLKEEEKKSYFFDLWTLKESYIKAIGKGLSVPLDSFSIIKTSNIVVLKPNENTLYLFKQYDIDPEYKMSVCSFMNTLPGVVELVSL